MTKWLLDTLLATSALILLVLMLREPVRRQFGSRIAYGLWLIPAARVFMPTLTHTVERAVPQPAGLQPLADPLLHERLWMARVAPPADASLFDRAGGWPTLIIGAWLCVGAGLFLSRMAAFHSDRRAILRSSTEVARAGSVLIVRSHEVTSPVALGILRPLIVVPTDFGELYGPTEQRFILEHEIAHHRSGDLVANLFAFVLLCLQWFNPLAWVAHAAFRFDQEAACDARVLDKVNNADRAEYGRAIAKAASGRALLFASALDRRHNLQRRLQSMLSSSNPARRLIGRAMVVSAIGFALPLTASRATEYVDIPLPAAPAAKAPTETAAVATSVRPMSGGAIAVAAQAAPAAAQPAARPASQDNITFVGDRITIDGQTKRWEELTAAEKSRVRAAIASARAALEQTHIDQAELDRAVAAVPSKARMAEIQGEIAKAQANIAESVRRIDQHAAEARAAGRQADQVEIAVRAALQSVQTTDFQAVARALAAVDQAKIAQSVSGAAQSVDKAKAELARLQARMEADSQK